MGCLANAHSMKGTSTLIGACRAWHRVTHCRASYSESSPTQPATAECAANCGSLSAAPTVAPGEPGISPLRKGFFFGPSSGEICHRVPWFCSFGRIALPFHSCLFVFRVFPEHSLFYLVQDGAARSATCLVLSFVL